MKQIFFLSFAFTHQMYISPIKCILHPSKKVVFSNEVNQTEQYANVLHTDVNDVFSCILIFR